MVHGQLFPLPSLNPNLEILLSTLARTFEAGILYLKQKTARVRSAILFHFMIRMERYFPAFLASENISYVSPRSSSSARNVPSGEERGRETGVFAGYSLLNKPTSVHNRRRWSRMNRSSSSSGFVWFVLTLDRGTPPWIDPTGVCSAWLILTIQVQTVL